MSIGQRLRQERLRRHLSQEALAAAIGVSARSINRWEQGRAVPQAQVRIQLSRFFDLPPQELFATLEAEIHSTPAWALPFPRNPFFTGREYTLETIHTLLTTTQPIALTGLGGIGKTQIALEYAYRHAQEYAMIFWLAAETPESLMRSLKQIADQLQLPERQAGKQARMVAAVRHWLVTHTGWLLIGDNVEDLDLLPPALLSLRQGAQLLTTRHQALGPLAQPLALPPMNSEEGSVLVLRRARRVPLSSSASPHPSLTSPDAPTLAETVELVHLLEGLPLALDQAGAYIEETGCSIANYVQRYRDQRQQMLVRRGIHDGVHPASVDTTLRLAVQRVAQAVPAAAELLHACAFLHPETIPEELFAAGAAYLGPVLGPVAADPSQFDLTLAALRSASLVTRQPETRTLSVHRLVQAVLQDQMEPDEARLWSERVIGMVDTAFPEGSAFADWQRCERYLVQALACVPLIEAAGHDCSTAGSLLYKAGSYLMARGRFREAEPLLSQALLLGERRYGCAHLDLMPLLAKQAELLWRQGNYEQVEPLLLRRLAIGEQALGPEHPQMVEALNHLANLYLRQGKYELAEPLYHKCLRMRERLLGAEHPMTAMALGNLALLYYEQAKYQLAEPLMQRSLHIQEYQSGKEHPYTLIQVGNLAHLYRDLGTYERAESLYQRALRTREHLLGFERSDAADVLGGLATLYQNQGKYDLAEPLYQRALRLQEQWVGSEHPDMITILHDLAMLYEKQGKQNQAEPLYRQALVIATHRLPGHPQTTKLRQEYHRLLVQKPDAPESD